MVYDNNYIRIEGWTGSATAYNNALNSCGARAVKDINIALDITWEGSALVGVNVDVINNESTTYTGHIHAYVTEINSRWWNQYGGQYHFAMIGNYALNQDISVPATGSSHYASTWNGNLYGMGDITQNNIMVIVSVFRTGTSTYADDTAAAAPLINNPPNTPDQPTGPAKGIVGTNYTYSTQATDPNNDNIYYLLDWGDGTNTSWLGLYASGAPVSATHSWPSFGIYNVQAKAKDIHNAVSAWSTPLSVRMYKVGDTSGNDVVGFDDINPFVLMLASGEAAYYQAFPNGYFYTGDINQDGSVNFGDINPFVALLSGG
jgi:hypothetical protein